MRAIVLADIHSNIWALEAIFRRETRYDAVYCAGDFTDYGPEPSRVIAFARDHGFVSVFGNHDAGLLATAAEETEAAARARHMAWKHDNFERMTEADWAFLRALPEQIGFEMDGIRYQMRHRMEESYEVPQYRAQFEALWPGERGGYRRLILGHTHAPCVYRMDNDFDWVNPGSVSYRNKKHDDGDRRAHYMIIENGEPRFEAADYDHALLMRALEERSADPRMDRRQVETGRYLFSNFYAAFADALAEAERQNRAIDEGGL